MGKSSSRRTNAFLKSKKKERYGRHTPMHSGNTPFRNEDKRKKGEITYVAVDSCILIDMMHMVGGHSIKYKDAAYFSKLRRLLDNCVFDENGNRRKNGRTDFQNIFRLYCDCFIRCFWMFFHLVFNQSKCKSRAIDWYFDFI